MNMKYQNSISRLQRYYQRCAIAISLVICLLLSNINFSMMLTYAKLDDQISFKVGDNVTAVLENGVLTLSGDGSTDNFSAETAPFLEYASSIQTLVIENGITTIGSYLFYGLGNLSGELVLPSSINHFGDYAFSGDSQQNAAHFSLIRNEFLSNEIVQQTPENQVPEVVPQPDTETNQPEDIPTDVNQPESDLPSVNDTPTPDNNSDNVGGNEQVPDNSQTDETQGNDDSVQNEQTGNESGLEDNPLLAVVGTKSFSMIKNLMNYTLSESDEIQEVPSDSIPSENGSADTNTDENLDSDVPNEVDPIIPENGVDNENGSDTPTTDSSNTTTDTIEPPVDEYPSVDDTISSNSDAASGSDVTNEPVIENPIYKVETITQQSISDPANLFYAGQVGIVVCSDQNESFLTAAIMAGYQKADGIVNVIIDDKNERKLPVYEGKITLPLQNEGSADPYAEDMFFIGKFEGWTKNVDSTVVYPAGSNLEVTPDSEISLYSTWTKEAKYRLCVKAVRKDDTASYSLIEESSQAPLNGIEGYEYQYQWQIADKNTQEDNRVWNNIAGAQSAVYERAVEPDDVSKLFRCVVTVVKQVDLLAESEPIQLFSEPIAAAVETKTVYVDAANGNDSSAAINDQAKPYKTLTEAAAQLTSEDADGTTESNVIVLLSDYQFDAALNANFLDVPVTIKGQTNTIKLIGLYSGDKDKNVNNQINLKKNVVFENITLDDVGHIYGNGNDITCGENVITVVSPYLYGAENGKIGDKVGKITIESGNYSRIAAYARSTSNTVDAAEKNSIITITGGKVDTIVSGSANGSINNADVTINISGTGTVTSLSGGCQGFNNNVADYSGKTVINISGGTVTNLYGAGTGRNASVPTFKGNLEIKVTGGEVENIYGAGTLAQVISDSTTTSLVDIDVSGGQVNNIYAAGIGGDENQYVYKTDDKKVIEYIKNPKELGSLTGNANITVSGNALVGHIYGSGKGFDKYENNKDKDLSEDFKNIIEGAKENAFVNGNVVININGGTITGDVYGGGEGINKDTYDKSARITEVSTVKVVINDGIIKGNVYGGGKFANNEGKVSVTLNNGTVEKNIYGGGNQGKLLNKSEVNIHGGTIQGSVYGGALGDTDKLLLENGSTVNMTGGTIHGNLYGGSQNSDDGNKGSKADLIFVNLVGGTIKGNVFGGSYKGYVNGSTHVHIGEAALAKCAYYTDIAHASEMPKLTGQSLFIEGSTYAGGDFGGDTINYDNITIAGFSHLYIDGNGYFDNDGKTMTISGGIFGSGASCDAGGVRLVTLDHFGKPAIDSTGKIHDSASTLTAIQRADQVRLINSHVRLTGQSDVANENQTAPYSLNQIGNLGLKDELINNIYGNSLVLQDGSTLVLDSAAIEIADLKSMSGEKIVTDTTVKNTILLNSGTVFRVAYTTKDTASTVYGNLYGKTYLLAGNTAEAYAYAANNTDQIQGEFIDLNGTDLSYESLTDFRYWKIKGDEASIALRNTVLTAQNVSSNEEYAVAQGSIELSPVTQNTSYKISKITIPVGLELVEIAKNKAGEWKLAGKVESNPTDVQLANEQNRINDNPLSVFGLYIGMGKGFSDAAKATGNVISNESAKYNSASSIIGNEIPASAVTEGNIPEVEFYLTFKNNAITISKDIGAVVVEVEQYENGILQDIIKMNIEIVTKANGMPAEQIIDLYASQDGRYTGELIIPAGTTMNLDLKQVSASSGSSLVNMGSINNPSDFAVTIQPINSSGWQSLSLTEPHDIKNTGSSVHLGTTDSRFEAAIEINLYNKKAFTSKTDDTVTLTFSDGTNSYNVKLNIHWVKSIVEKTELYKGKQYNGIQSGNSAVISPNGAVTAVFTFNNRGDLNTMWLEKGSLPTGTKMTLLGYNNEFYTYTISGNETDGKILLSEFTKMWSSASKLSGTVEKDQQLKLILDFDQSPLLVGSYSIVLKNKNGAEPDGQEFIVTSALSPSLTINQTAESNKYSIQLSNISDSRFNKETGIVLTLDNEKLPEWLKFSYQDKTYSPVNGKLYLPNLYEGTSIIMDTTNAPDFYGSKTIKADVYAIGLDASSSAIASLSTSINITAVPAYALDVSLGGAQERLVKAKDTLTFDVSYTLKNVSQAKIAIDVLKKSDTGYKETANWNITGSTDITTGGTGTIQITVPDNTEKGTYRILFTLGNQEVPYNIIVQ